MSDCIALLGQGLPPLEGQLESASSVLVPIPIFSFAFLIGMGRMKIENSSGIRERLLSGIHRLLDGRGHRVVSPSSEVGILIVEAESMSGRILGVLLLLLLHRCRCS